MGDPRRDWNERHRAGEAATAMPARVLKEYLHLLPRCGLALDLACGLGGNARLLAAQGLEVMAWDIADVAIEKLAAHAVEQGLSIVAERRDVVARPPEPRRFDVIVVSRFLERSLFPALAEALRPGGLLFYQTFTREAVGLVGPSNPAYRLGPNELLQAFASLRVLVDREEGVIGDTAQGLRNEALLVAQRSSAPEDSPCR